ncbi:hypothetical protein TSUD_29020 [Trifolium subterraneum]|uniref:Reverse transcriptase zinc-binding domain-containing protein n=1 Tax=Trifolium subterraneum TaxID=3900 RepID=A0A2Z6P387_TRISU|nr:hypothetical protein TSUD_29020 [Trifolium subterraneum]
MNEITSLKTLDIPDATVNGIEKMLNSFWWVGGNNNNRGIRWLSWERLTCAKVEGGLGFRDFKVFNMAMVAKQGWKIITRPETLVGKIFKARWSMGDGRKIKVMTDPWLREARSGWMRALQSQSAYNLRVNDLMLEEEKQRDTFRIIQLFSHDMTDKIFDVPLFQEVTEDSLVWKEEKNGEYMVRSGYKHLLREKEVGRRRGIIGSWRVCRINGYGIMRGKKTLSWEHKKSTCGKIDIEHKLSVIIQELINRFNINFLGDHRGKGG